MQIETGLAGKATTLVAGFTFAVLGPLAALDIERFPGTSSTSDSSTLESSGEIVQGVDLNFNDHFDVYATDSQMHGQGGWRGWDNVPGAGAFTRSTQDRSAPNSVEIVGAADLVHQFTGITAGTWTFTAWQYITAPFTGESYFILLNDYNEPDGAPKNWSTQVKFDSVTDTLFHDSVGTPCTGSLPIVYDAWVEIRVVIDLVLDSQSFFYGGSLLSTCSWTDGASGNGFLAIEAVDLFAFTGTVVFYDDISLSNLPFEDGFETGDARRWHFATP